MATQFSNTLTGTNATAASFRAWAQFIDDLLLVTGGWVNTADTGQLNIAAAAAPVGANSKIGYRIYRMNDALQAASPIFLRIDYGSGGSATVPGIWLTIGTGSNGAGTITGIAFNGGAFAAPTVTSAQTNAGVTNSYGSADSSRFQIMLFVSTMVWVISLERSKSLTGADNGDGVILVYGDGTGSIGALSRVAYVVRTGGASPPAEVGVTCAISNQTASAFSADVGIGLPIPFKGIAQPIGLGVCIVNSGDFLAQAQIIMNVYGANRNYVLHDFAGSSCYVPTGAGNASLRTNTRIGIRYD